MFKGLEEILGIGVSSLKSVLGIKNEMRFPTTSAALSHSTQIAQEESNKGLYQGQGFSRLKNTLGLNYEDAQIASWRQGLKTGDPILAAQMGNNPALANTDFTGSMKSVKSPLTGYHISRANAVDKIRQNGFDLSKVGSESGSLGDPKGAYFFPDDAKIPNDWMSVATDKNTLKIDLNVSNPYEVTKAKDYLSLVKEATGKKFADINELRFNATPEDGLKITEFLQNKGYDALIDKKGTISFREPQIIVFDPKKIGQEKPLDLNFWTPEQIEKYQYQDIIPRGPQRLQIHNTVRYYGEYKNSDPIRGGTWYTTPKNNINPMDNWGVGGDNILKKQLKFKNPLELKVTNNQLDYGSDIIFSKKYANILSSSQIKKIKEITNILFNNKLNNTQKDIQINKVGSSLNINSKEINKIIESVPIDTIKAIHDLILSKILSKRGYDGIILKAPNQSDFFKFKVPKFKKNIIEPELKTGQPYEAIEYRGEKEMLDKRDEKDLLFGRGLYTTPNKEYAKEFGDVKEVRVSLKNPYVITDPTESIKAMNPDFLKKLRDDGCDGIIERIKGSKVANQTIQFNPITDKAPNRPQKIKEDYYYHITSNKNIESIKKTGLDPKKADSENKLTHFYDEPAPTYDDEVLLRVKQSLVNADESDIAPEERFFVTPEKTKPENLEIKVGKKWISLKDFKEGFSTAGQIIKTGGLMAAGVAIPTLAQMLGQNKEAKLQDVLGIKRGELGGLKTENQELQNKIEALKSNKIKPAIITIYEPDPKQTDSSPHQGGFMTKMEFGDIAIGNRDEYEEARSKYFKDKTDTFVTIPELSHIKTPYGDGVFRVRDTMNIRYDGDGRVDIFIPKDRAEVGEQIRRVPVGTYFY